MDEAYRLTFVFEGENVELGSMERLEMRVPAGAELAVTESAVGHFVELRNSGGASLYRRSFLPPRLQGLEYPAEEGRMEWAAASRPAEVSVLVPAPDEGGSVALVAAPPIRRGLLGFFESFLPSRRRRDLVSVELPGRLESRE